MHCVVVKLYHALGFQLISKHLELVNTLPRVRLIEHRYPLLLRFTMKVDPGQNVRLVVSLWRFIVSALRYF